MKLSATEVALVPPGPMTVTWTVSTERAGAMAVIDVSEFTMKLGDGVDPNVTDSALRFCPVMTTLVPPVTDPVVVDRPETVGAGATSNGKANPARAGTV